MRLCALRGKNQHHLSFIVLISIALGFDIGLGVAKTVLLAGLDEEV